MAEWQKKIIEDHKKCALLKSQAFRTILSFHVNKCAKGTVWFKAVISIYNHEVLKYHESAKTRKESQLKCEIKFKIISSYIIRLQSKQYYLELKLHNLKTKIIAPKDSNKTGINELSSID